MAVAILAGRYSFSQPGYRGIRVLWLPVIASVIVAGAIPVTAVVLAPLVGSWIWLLCGVVLAAGLLIAGSAYRKR